MLYTHIRITCINVYARIYRYTLPYKHECVTRRKSITCVYYIVTFYLLLLVCMS